MTTWESFLKEAEPIKVQLQELLEKYEVKSGVSVLMREGNAYFAIDIEAFRAISEGNYIRVGATSIKNDNMAENEQIRDHSPIELREKAKEIAKHFEGYTLIEATYVWGILKQEIESLSTVSSRTC